MASASSKRPYRPELSLSFMEPHPMKADLDTGRLTSKCRDRKLTTFLDLKFDYHSEFITRLREHVQTSKNDWFQLYLSEADRRSCAEKFVDKYGMTYWGTEESRKKHLLPDALEEPGALCTYPERKDEIIRTVALLLERKANSNAKPKEKKNSMESVATPTRTSASVPPFWGGSSLGTSTPRMGTFKPATDPRSDGDHRQKKRKMSIELGMETPDPRAQKLTASARGAIRPFSSIVAHEDEKASIPYEETNLTAHPIVADSNIAPSTESDQVSSSEEKYQKETMFLVEASNQEGMAPVWVPFQNFPCSSTFLAHMAAELQAVLAASVKFEWSGFEIRVRQGKDCDWAIVVDALHKAWKAKELVLDDSPVRCFRIRVMLHLT
ncbi:uncharacterized protein BDW43DRAFT_310970 [Aspergillus alliaceus]|uniref:uncharacterized protein n=1 Tax=Petromyces alliaceus TaxID=209559 RepID=UPI0012A74A16|nr:uncharacterized protein BDW43DRAFT_310970 [Aspergillus alliaceus]KAB8233619.1 hypothetical protein BDW43DRAFT_310970 [Aspergillus alliaceus]